MSVILNNVDRIVNSSGDAIDFAQGVGGGSSKEFVATGNISQGQTVGLKADGTVEVITDTATAQTESIGTSVQFHGRVPYSTSSHFDPSQNKVVLVYYAGQTSASQNYGTAVVGTVSGESISFGSPVVFQSSEVYPISSTFDTNQNKVVISYTDRANNSKGMAIVGKVSGNSISFGAPVTFHSSVTGWSKPVFDPNSNKVVIFYGYGWHNGRSDYGCAIVGTVSGDSISFGSPVVYDSQSTYDLSATFDSSQNKAVLAYLGVADGYGLRAIVGTVSGDSISFGSSVKFFNGLTQAFSATFDSAKNKVVIGYRDISTNNYAGNAIVGTVSGNSISFGSPVVFDNGHMSYISSTFDSNVNRVIIVYRTNSNGQNISYVVAGSVSGNTISFDTPFNYINVENSLPSLTFDPSQNKVVIAYPLQYDKGYAIVYTPPGATVNTNASSWLGIADEAITSGNSGKVNLNGGIDSHQTGLNAGNTYYVNYDGALTDTPNEGAKNGTYGKIGKALSSTSLLLSK